MYITHEVELPGGILQQDGSLLKKVTIREISGNLQATVAARAKASPASALAILIQQSIEPQPGKIIRESDIMSMLNGDIDTILLGLHEATYPGETLNMKPSCASCDEKFEIALKISDIPYNKLEQSENTYWEYDEVADEWISGKFEVVDGELCFYLKNDKLKLDACFKYPTFKDSAEVMKVGQQNPIEARHRLYAACLKKWNGKDASSVSAIQLGMFSSSVLEFIDDAFNLIPPGPDGPIISYCTLCGAENEVPLNPAAFLSRLVGRQKNTKKRSSKRRN